MAYRNVCLSCGACCASFRASFYWAEADDTTPGGVPTHLTRVLTPFFRVMRGTEGSSPRCIAIEGEVGQRVACSIHPLRPTTCREFPASYEDGVTPHDRCDQARAKWGMPPLRPEDWLDPEEPDEPDRPAA